MHKDTRKLAAVLAADVVEYSRLMGADEQNALAALKVRRAIFDELVDEFDGREFGSVGDSLMAAFPSAVNAVLCALAVQRRTEDENASLPADRRMRLRMGVNLGDVIEEKGAVFGDAVNVAARLQALARPGGILISAPVRDQVRPKVTARFVDAGMRQLKNVRTPVRTFEVLPASPPGVGGKISELLGHVASRRVRRATLGVMIIAVAVALSLLWREIFAPGTDMPVGQHECDTGICALAVLPLTNLSGNSDEDYFADGITEALISRLARIESLRVISHTTVMQYKKAPKPLPDVARELGVDAVLAGAVRRENGRVRISVQLIRVPIEQHLWTYETERPLQDAMMLEVELAQGIAQEIQIRATEEQRQRLTASRPIDPVAFDAYLKGRDLWRRRTEPAKAIEWLERAVSLDPAFAQAWAALADAYITAWNWAVVPIGEGLPKAKAAAERALALDPEFGEAHASLASILWDTWNLTEAEHHFEQAIRLNPSHSLARQWYAEYLANTAGRTDEALVQAEAARRLDPLLMSTNATLAWVEIYAGRYEQARERLRELLKTNPEYPWSYQLLAELEVRVGRYAEALDLLERSRMTDEPRDIIEARRARVYAAWGKTDEALPILERLAALADRPPEATYDMARAYARLGRPQDAFRYLDSAYAVRSLYLLRLNTEPDFDAMRGDRQFCDLVIRIGIPSACRARSSGLSGPSTAPAVRDTGRLAA